MNPFDPNAPTQANNQTPAVAELKDLVSIGPYKILRLLGKGGMGQVFLGESSAPKRLVAIKLMLADRIDGESLARFRREMEVLARLNHRGIAQLFEVGYVVIGNVSRPWYAMEYIEGLTLDQHVREAKLDTRAIVSLCAKVARALHYAHQRGVIHRDIKPANIVVDSVGQPKILDFGIAKLSAKDGLNDDTRFGQIVGTLAYMSPEQLDASHQVDVRSDVYALGIVIYQLLSGQLPFELSTTSLLDAIKELTEGRRQRLSERNARFRGDIELIVDTATQRDIEQRYESAATLANDLDGFLDNRPIQARRASVLYVARKFTERNPLVVGALSLAAVALLVATLWSMVSAERARDAQAIAVNARAQAEARAAEANAVVGFLNDALAGAAPNRALGREVKLVDVLGDASRQQLPPEQANIEVKIRQTLLETYLGLGLYPEAQAEVERITALCAKLTDVDGCALLRSLRARTLSLSGQHEAALPLSKQALTEVQAHFGIASEPAINAQLDYADALNQIGDSKASLKELQDAAQKVLRNPALPAKLDLKLNNYLSDTLAEIGDLKQAEAILAEALKRAQDRLGNDDPSVLLARNSLITFLNDRGDPAAAAREFSALFKDAERVLGPEHRVTMTVLGNLAATQAGMRDFESAESNLKRRAEVFSRRYANDWKSILNNAVSLASVQYSRQQLDNGLRDINAAIAKAPADSFPAELANAWNWQALFLWKLGRLPEAQTRYEELIQRFESSFGNGDVQLERYRSRLGEVLIAQRQFDRGRALIEAALPALEKSYGPTHVAVKDAKAALLIGR